MQAGSCGDSVPKICCCSPGGLTRPLVQAVLWQTGAQTLCDGKYSWGLFQVHKRIMLNAFLGHVHFIKIVNSQPSQKRKCWRSLAALWGEEETKVCEQEGPHRRALLWLVTGGHGARLHRSPHSSFQAKFVPLFQCRSFFVWFCSAPPFPCAATT